MYILYICMYICVCVCVYIYIYIYTNRPAALPPIADKESTEKRSNRYSRIPVAQPHEHE